MAAEVISLSRSVDYPADLRRGADALRNGQLLVLPTETVYGVAAALTQPEAVRQLREMRGDTRGETRTGGSAVKPFTVHLAAPRDALRFIGETSEFGHRMIRKLWPGPIAISFDVSADRQQEIVAAEHVARQDLFDGDTITLRCPDHLVVSEMLRQVGAPVAFTKSGSGDRPPAADEADARVSLIFDAGPCRFSKPSTIVRLMPGGDRYEIVRAGVYDERIIERLLMTTVLFVCSGNTCRSPMAEALARRIVADRLNISLDQLSAHGINVVSAGSFAMPGNRATPEAVSAVRALGGDLSTHRSQGLSVELIHQADVIFAMGQNHARAVISLVPAAAEKTTTLDPQGDIEDPIGGDGRLYQELAVQLQRLIGSRLNETLWADSPRRAPAESAR